MPGFRLGVDYGTSNTVAALRRPDARTDLLLFDGSPLLPSGAFRAADGSLLTGRDAAYSARARPDRFEPAPKRCIDDGVVLIGDGEVPVVAVIGATLRRVRLEAEAAAGEPVTQLVLTYPASWGPRRRQVLAAACQEAGLPSPTLLPEPIAAAHYYATRAGAVARPGDRYLVYDLGAGTFDATVVQARDGGFVVQATGGLPDTGGLDIDATIMAYLSAVYADRAPEVWRSLEQPADAAQRRLSRQLWDDIRAAKEILSRASATFLHIPGSDIEVPLGREQLDRIATPVLRRTVTYTQTLLRDATGGGPAPTDVDLLLVGGASRMPLVATLLHQQLGRAPHVVEQPELVVALGAVAAAAAEPGPTKPSPGTSPAATEPAAPRAARRPSRQPAPSPPDDVEPAPPPPTARPEQPLPPRPGKDRPVGSEGHAHLLYVILPAVEGYTVRRYQQRRWDGSTWVEEAPTFLTRDGRLLLFARPGLLLTHLHDTPAPGLRIDSDWLEAVEQTIEDLDLPADATHPLPGLIDDSDCVNLDLALFSAAGGPRLWTPELLVPARNLAAELAHALDLDVADLLDEAGPIDHLDDLLRVSGPRALMARRRSRSVDSARIAADWRALVEAIEAAAVPM